MAGSATLTTVESRKTTVEPRIVATRVRRCWRLTGSSLRSPLTSIGVCSRDLCGQLIRTPCVTPRGEIVKRLPLVVSLVVLCHGIAASPAQAKGVEMGAAGQGVTVSGSPYRYVSITPNATPRRTIVTRIERQGGSVNRWWYMRGIYGVPAVAYDGTGGGLSADG